MAPQDRIVVDPAIHHGKPVIRGTRVPVEVLLGSLAGGTTADDVAREYGVTVDDVRAALQYAYQLVASEDVVPLHA